MNQILDKLEQIHGSVSVVGSMNADYTVTTERLPGPGETVTGGPLPVEYIEAQRDLLTASSVLGLCLESPLETVTACATMCHDAGMKVLLNDSPFIATLPSELIAHADILLVNEHELVQLLHIDEPEDDDWDSFDWAQAQNRLSEFGFDQAIVTLGGDGSVVLDSTVDPSIIRIAPVRVDAVDTTGCGDSFMGTVLASLASGLSLEESAQLATYVSA